MGAPEMDRLPGYEEEKIYAIVSVWLESLLYGCYLVLFVDAVKVMSKRWSQTSKVFFYGIFAMFVLTTLVTAFKGYTLVLAYAKTTGGTKEILAVLHDFPRWDIFGRLVMVNMVVWIADMLAIYRCYIIWNRSWLIILLPTVVVLASIGKGIVSLHWLLHIRTASDSLRDTAILLMRLCYPFSLAQNCMTTGLILYKIYRQHRRSRSAGLVKAMGGSVSLKNVLYVIIESASVYTILMLGLVVVYSTQHRSAVILQACIAPCASMIFVLMATRMDAVRARVGRAGRSLAVTTEILRGSQLDGAAGTAMKFASFNEGTTTTKHSSIGEDQAA